VSQLLPALVAAALGCFTAGAALALVLGRRPDAVRRVAYPAAALGSAGVAAAGIAALGGVPWTLAVAWVLPPPGLELALDRLGGLFLVLVGGAGFAASVYALDYTRGESHGAGGQAFAYNAFLAAMALVVLAANLWSFLIAWELMALASYFLVMAEPGKRAVARAGWVYAVVTHAGLACLAAAMLLLVGATGSDRFADWAVAAPALPPGTRTAAFVLFLLGFGSKAGLVPLHVWLPLAHPVAPSHVSALMSGVMIKFGVYGLLRVGFEWLAGGPAWWGATLLTIGAVSAVLGVLYALVEHDLKRLLAYHSIENIGIIFLGVGAGLVFQATGSLTLAHLGLLAAVYHTANHATFKTLLFLAAGAVLHATGTRNMEAMGGLVKRMPGTAACFLVGAAAISALPPLNGFVSEWLTFQVLLQSAQVPRPELNLVFLLGLAGLALTGGLAAACFVKAFGISFLALPRSAAAAEAREAPATMRAAMFLLAAACVGLGVGAAQAVPVLGRATAGLVGRAGTASPPFATGGLTLVVGDGFGALSPLAVAVLLGLALVALPVGLRLLGARRDRRVYETWGCGRSLQTARMEYTATAFSQPFKRIFAVLYRPVKQLDIEFHAESRFFVRTIRYENPTRSLVDEWLYAPALTGALRLAHAVRRIQSGSANAYLAYIFVALLLALLVAGR
jgi:hydrogenase-4 component B